MDFVHKPELKFLINRENGELFPLIDSHIFTTFITIFFLNIFLISVLLGLLKLVNILINIGYDLFDKLWLILTPGNQWLEIIFITICVLFGATMIIIMNELLKKLDITFTKLQHQIKEKNMRIAELELILEKNINEKEVEREKEVEKEREFERENEVEREKDVAREKEVEFLNL